MPNHRIGCLGAPGAPKALSPTIDLAALGAQGAQGLMPYLRLEYRHLLYSILDSHLPGRLRRPVAMLGLGLTGIGGSALSWAHPAGGLAPQTRLSTNIYHIYRVLPIALGR